MQAISSLVNTIWAARDTYGLAAFQAWYICLPSPRLSAKYLVRPRRQRGSCWAWVLTQLGVGRVRYPVRGWAVCWSKGERNSSRVLDLNSGIGFIQGLADIGSGWDVLPISAEDGNKFFSILTKKLEVTWWRVDCTSSMHGTNRRTVVCISRKETKRIILAFLYCRLWI